MELIRLNGTWDIPLTGESHVGELLIDEENASIILWMTVLGSEKRPFPALEFRGRTDIIIGHINTGGTIILYDCETRKSHGVMFQRTDIAIIAKYAFWELNVGEIKELVFPKIRIDYGEILEWSRLCYIDWDLGKSDDNHEVIIWHKEKKIEFSIDTDKKISFIPVLCRAPSINRNVTSEIKQKVYIDLEYDNPSRTFTN